VTAQIAPPHSRPCSFTLEQLDEFCSHSAFKSLSFIGRCLVCMNILGPKIGSHEIGHKQQHGDFFENSNNYD
jgi:aromatic ring hydroxylase